MRIVIDLQSIIPLNDADIFNHTHPNLMPPREMNISSDIFSAYIRPQIPQLPKMGMNFHQTKFGKNFYDRNVIMAPVSKSNYATSRGAYRVKTKRRRSKILSGKATYPLSDGSVSSNMDTDRPSLPVYIYDERDRRNRFMPDVGRKMYKCKEPKEPEEEPVSVMESDKGCCRLDELSARLRDIDHKIDQLKCPVVEKGVGCAAPQSLDAIVSSERPLAVTSVHVKSETCQPKNCKVSSTHALPQSRPLTPALSTSPQLNRSEAKYSTMASRRSTIATRCSTMTNQPMKTNGVKSSHYTTGTSGVRNKTSPAILISHSTNGELVVQELKSDSHYVPAASSPKYPSIKSSTRSKISARESPIVKTIVVEECECELQKIDESSQKQPSRRSVYCGSRQLKSNSSACSSKKGKHSQNRTYYACCNRRKSKPPTRSSSKTYLQTRHRTCGDVCGKCRGEATICDCKSTSQKTKTKSKSTSRSSSRSCLQSRHKTLPPQSREQATIISRPEPTSQSMKQKSKSSNMSPSNTYLESRDKMSGDIRSRREATISDYEPTLQEMEKKSKSTIRSTSKTNLVSRERTFTTITDSQQPKRQTTISDKQSVRSKNVRSNEYYYDSTMYTDIPTKQKSDYPFAYTYGPTYAGTKGSKPIPHVKNYEQCIEIGSGPIQIGYATTIVSRFPNFTVYEVLRPNDKKPQNLAPITENVFVVKNRRINGN